MSSIDSAIDFFSYAEKTLDVLDDGIASIKRSAMGNGTIRLGLVRPLGISYVPEMAAAFIKKNPKLDIDFLEQNNKSYFPSCISSSSLPVTSV